MSRVKRKANDDNASSYGGDDFQAPKRSDTGDSNKGKDFKPARRVLFEAGVTDNSNTSSAESHSWVTKGPSERS